MGDDKARFLALDPLRQIGACVQAFNTVEALVVERIIALVGAERHKVEILVHGLAAREKFSAYKSLIDNETDAASVPERDQPWLRGLDSLGRTRNAIAHTVLGDAAPTAHERARFALECDEAIFGLQQALQTSPRNAKRQR